MMFSSGEARTQLSGARVATTVARVASFFSVFKAKDLTVMPCELVVTSQSIGPTLKTLWDKADTAAKSRHDEVISSSAFPTGLLPSAPPSIRRETPPDRS